MLYITLIASLILSVYGQYEPLTLVSGTIFQDYLVCNQDAWYFENPDVTTHSRHRNGDEDMTDTCYYGEWTGGGTVNNNLYAEAQWMLYEEDGVTPMTDPALVNIRFRLYGYCDYEPADWINVFVRDDHLSNGDPNDPQDDTWGRTQMLGQWSKNRGNCNGWNGQLTSTNTAWLEEVQCTNGNNGVSCYQDISLDYVIMTPPRIAIRWEAKLDNGWGNEAWAFSDVKVELINNVVTPCCTGTRSLHPSKSCSAFGEQRNCENKGCVWSGASHCSIPCCRKEISASKRKPKCKEFSYNLDLCGVTQRGDCEVRNCNCNGFWDGLSAPNGDPCPPEF
jgi:hypothetical protein